MKKKTKSKSRSPVVHAYQSNPYALQRRNAPAAPPELVPLIVQPSRRRRIARVARRVKERATDRLSSNQFLAEAGITAASAGVAALATGWLAGKGANPWAVGIGTAVVGAAGALVAPGAWRGAGLGISGWGVGQVVATAMQQHAINEFKRQKKIEEQKEEQKALEQQKLEQAAGQKALPAPARPSNAFMPAISDAFANSRTYGHYGRADDEERYLDLDLVLR